MGRISKNQQGGPLRSTIVRKMEIWGPYKWPYEWVNGVITPLNTSITLLITGGGPPCPSFHYFSLTCLRHYRHVEGDLASKFGAKSDFRKADEKMRCTGYGRNSQAEYDLLFGIKILIKVHSLSTILCVCCVNVDMYVL